ncbi:MAG TPA: Crp/Fnr family transcriptional regulator [Candidatus Binataceae bacterium]|nr:Crp/Fnr family transcriptional regulator [Candidatus Binataceae bacterium]
MSWYFPESALEKFFPRHVVQSHQRNRLIYQTDGPSDVLYWVKKGIVELRCPYNQGRSFLARLVAPNELFGFEEIDVAGDSTQLFEARAWTNCELVMVTKERVLRALQSLDSATLTSVITHINKAWAHQAHYWASFVLMDCRERLACVLADLARRFGAQEKRGVMIVLSLTHQDLSEMVGFSRALTSRVLAEMVDEGTIVVEQNHFLIPHESSLLTSR